MAASWIFGHWCSTMNRTKLLKAWKTFFILTWGHAYWFLERGKAREREGERNIDRLPLVYAPTRDHTCNLGMCPDWESNLRSFGLQGNAQPTEPHWPVLEDFLIQYLNLPLPYPPCPTKPFTRETGASSRSSVPGSRGPLLTGMSEEEGLVAAACHAWDHCPPAPPVPSILCSLSV